MGCCGNSRRASTGAAGVSRGVKPKMASRKGALKWVHISPNGARTRYGTQEEAEAAKRLIGGSAVPADQDS